MTTKGLGTKKQLGIDPIERLQACSYKEFTSPYKFLKITSRVC